MTPDRIDCESRRKALDQAAAVEVCPQSMRHDTPRRRAHLFVNSHMKIKILILMATSCMDCKSSRIEEIFHWRINAAVLALRVEDFAGSSPQAVLRNDAALLFAHKVVHKRLDHPVTSGSAFLPWRATFRCKFESPTWPYPTTRSGISLAPAPKPRLNPRACLLDKLVEAVERSEKSYLYT